MLDADRRLEPGADPQLSEALGHEGVLFDAEGFVEGAGARPMRSRVNERPYEHGIPAGPTGEPSSRFS